MPIPGNPGLTPAPVSIHPLQVQAIYKQIMDHLTPQELQQLKAHLSPQLVQLLMKANLPQFAGLVHPAVQGMAQQQQQAAPQQAIAQQLYRNLMAQRMAAQQGQGVPPGVQGGPPVQGQ